MGSGRFRTKRKRDVLKGLDFLCPVTVLPNRDEVQTERPCAVWNGGDWAACVCSVGRRYEGDPRVFGLGSRREGETWPLGGDVPIVSTRVREDRDSGNGRHHVVGGARFRGHLYNTLTTCELSSRVKALDTTRSYGIRREKMFQASK